MLAALLVATATPAPTFAATFTVDAAAVDAPDASPGDGVCATSAGTCSLRAAIQESNATAGTDTIAFPAISVLHLRDVVKLTVGGAGEDFSRTGDLDVTDSVVVKGNGARRTILDAGALGDRALDVDPLGTGAAATISGVTIRGGSVTGDGGAIRAGGTVALSRSTLTGNSASGTGGALYVKGTATAVLSLDAVSDNHATSSAGGIGNAGTLTLRDSTVEANRGDGYAGGLWLGGAATLVGDTIARNEAKGIGGWFQFAGGITVGGSASLSNVTVSGNVGDPGGIHSGGPTRLQNVTIFDNTGAIYNCAACGGSVRAVNTIVAKSGFFANVNCYEPIVSLGHNIDDGTACGFTATGDLQNTAPQLEPLAYSVGPTPVHAFPFASPARDAGDQANCTASDQRHVSRNQGATCDTGAYELQLRRFVVNTTTDAVDVAPGNRLCDTATPKQCSLRAAIMEANADKGTDLIGFRVNGGFALTLTGPGENAAKTGDLDITDDLTILGRGTSNTVVSNPRGSTDRVFEVYNAKHPGVTVAISGMKITGGRPPAPADGGGVLVGDYLDGTPARLVLADSIIRSNVVGALSIGGGIGNDGTLVLVGSQVTRNRASSGGGAGSGNTAVASLARSTVAGNVAADNGGGLLLAPDTVTSFDDVRVASNTAGINGGGVWNGGTATGAKVVLDRNSATPWGGGLYGGPDSSTKLTDSTVSANHAGSGGGIFVNSGTLTVAGSTLNANDAAGFGGGGIENALGSVSLTNSTISDNTGNFFGGGVRTGGGTTLLTYVTVAGNTAGTGGALFGPATARDTILDGGCYGVVTSLGHNLDSGSSCGLTGPGDLSAVAPLLGLLATNGGPTSTRALLGGSPAIDAASATCAATDQRGVTRPQGPACDIGAYEAP